VLAQLFAASEARQAAIVEAVVNGRPMGTVFAVSERGQVVAIDATSLRDWRVLAPSSRTLEFEGRSYVMLSELGSATVSFDQRMQRLTLDFAPEAFSPSDLRFRANRTPALSPVTTAGVLNYTLFGYTSRDDSYGAGFFEAGVSGTPGSLIATASANTAAPGDTTTNRLVRYDTVFRRDDPDGLRTLLLGDSFTRSSSWGRSVRFGGVQYGTNFSLQPDLITYPLQAFPGTAVVPSTVDVFVNGSRIDSQQVQPGPFKINDVPLVSGSGEVQLVVRDAFGQQQVLTQPFYASRRLLRSGLEEFQVSAGTVRENYGLDSFNYGTAVGAGYWRRGLSDQFTLEARAEADENVYAGGITADFSIGMLGTVTAGAALSDGQAGYGNLWIAGYEYLGRRFNFAARSFWASSNFRAVGDYNLPVIQRQSFVSAGTNLGPAGTVGVAWAAQYYRALPSIDTVALTYSVTVVPQVFLTMSVSRTYSVINQTSAFATLSFVLGGRSSAGLEASSARGGGESTSYGAWSVQQTLPTDEGFGYRLRSTSNDQLDAGVGYTWRYGTYLLEASRFQGETAARATASGGFGFINGYAFASRPVTESFGLVQVGEIEGVRVLHNGNPVGTTDSDGRIILQRMTPYVANRVTIDERDLPIDVAIGSREQNVVPKFRSGILINYDAKRRISAILEVQTTDGRHLPAGTEVSLADSNRRFTVGEKGEMFVPDLTARSRFVAQLREGTCGFEVKMEAASAEVLPKLGPFVCQADK
jgi:outer membrane usher protein